VSEAASFESQERLEGRDVLVAGGLGAVGRATAAHAARLGARVILLHRRPEAELAECLAALDGSGHFGVQASISDSESLAQAAAAV